MKKISDFIKENKKSIAISITVGVFLFYMRPVLDFIGLKTINFLSFISESFSSYFYNRIAENNIYLFQERNNYFLITAIFLAIYVYFSKNIRTIKITIKELENEIAKDSEEGIQSNNVLTQSTTMSEFAKEKLPTLNKILNKTRLFYFALMLYATWFILLHSFYGILARENIDFNRKITIIRPYVGEETTKLFEASWVMMENKADYDSIWAKIDRIGSSALKTERLVRAVDSLRAVERNRLDSLKVLYTNTKEDSAFNKHPKK